MLCLWAPCLCALCSYLALAERMPCLSVLCSYRACPCCLCTVRDCACSCVLCLYCACVCCADASCASQYGPGLRHYVRARASAVCASAHVHMQAGSHAHACAPRTAAHTCAHCDSELSSTHAAHWNPSAPYTCACTHTHRQTFAKLPYLRPMPPEQ